MTIFVLVMAIAGFFPFNYHPAILYLGDTGPSSLVFMIAVLSLQGLEECDSCCGCYADDYLGSSNYGYLLAIVRRTLSGQSFMRQIGITCTIAYFLWA